MPRVARQSPPATPLPAPSAAERRHSGIAGARPRAAARLAGALALIACAAVHAWSQPYTVTRLAGAAGGPGASDGTGPVARLHDPAGIAIDLTGIVYVADTKNHVIRKVTPAGAVTTIAGLAGVAGFADGSGSTARFDTPTGIAVDRNGALYVADRMNHVIRRLTPDGQVSTLAGQFGQSGSLDGLGNGARFMQPRGVAVDGLGTVYVGDTGNHTVRKITVSGRVTTVAGSAGATGEADGTGTAARFNQPMGVAVDSDGNVFVADNQNSVVRKVSPAGVVTTFAGTPGAFGSTNGSAASARFNAPAAVAVDPDGNVFVADTGNASIRMVSTAAVVTTFAGASGNTGFADGTGSDVRFTYPEAIAAATDGSLRIADTQNHTVRVVTASAAVTTLAGFAPTWGTTDGAGVDARVQAPRGVAVNTAGTIYVADTLNYTIRTISPSGVVATLAGQAGSSGTADGTGTAARFFNPMGIALDANGNLYVADNSNHTIRKVTPAGVVTTLAGMPGQFGTANGTGGAARFRFPSAVAVDAGGNVYVADRSNHAIRKVTPAGVVTTLAGSPGTLGSTDGIGTAARFRQPSGVAIGPGGIVYVTDTANRTIRAITPSGEVTTLAGVAGQQGSDDGVGVVARFQSPYGIASDGAGALFVTDDLGHTVRRVTTSGDVTTIAGRASVSGSADGSGEAARFSAPSAAAVGQGGVVLVADRNNHAIRRGVPTNGATATLTASAGGNAQGAIASLPAGITCGGDCSEAYAPGSIVTLTATPAVGSMFVGWSGGGCSGSALCVTPVVSATSVTATFAVAPAPLYTRYLAEGATSSFFDTRIALLNPTATATTATLSFLKAGASAVVTQVPVPARSRATVDPKLVAGLAVAEFATKVESSVPLVVDRTLSWDVATGYGAHAETAVAAPQLTWFLAEGATHSGFNLFYLLQNPNGVEAAVDVRFLRPSDGPLEKSYVLPPNSRTNIWVNVEEFAGLGAALASTDVSAVFEVTNGQPIIVERALYLDRAGQTFAAGHESAGVSAPATDWFLAEGATGDYFDLFVLVANPNPADALIEETYLLPDGTTVERSHIVPANSRMNIWVDVEDPRLADTAVSTTIHSVYGEPLIVERALWWPGSFAQWQEAHNSPGATATGTQWALAEGEVGGTRGTDTYILIANTSVAAGTVRVTVLFEDGTSAVRDFAVAAKSRFNVDVRNEFPGAVGRRFGAIVESLGASPLQIVVERAMYWNASGQTWAAGTNALATRLQ